MYAESYDVNLSVAVYQQHGGLFVRIERAWSSGSGWDVKDRDLDLCCLNFNDVTKRL
jgi:hypothetical protein